ncbi:hypothetical protein HS1genome_1045 [Sulfodiicoccus acidiphilus]|uniref:Uncharacterized protein n=1 Tax=Sulfodiicoccus acidiphilus TaxID=1670455 RepID=A0A348B3A4_9CREN|nr:hypothetical protein HS1genome_1045 [Sulfodiicoccus acidiphilus]
MFFTRIVDMVSILMGESVEGEQLYKKITELKDEIIRLKGRETPP